MKKKLLIYIDESLDRDFRRFIVLKYGKYQRGLISYEVSQALKYWLALHTQEHKLEERRFIKKPRDYEKWCKVKDYLLSKYYSELKPGQKINGRHLREAIRAMIGSDRRTIKKYLRLFRLYGWLEHVTGEVWIIKE